MGRFCILARRVIFLYSGELAGDSRLSAIIQLFMAREGTRFYITTAIDYVNGRPYIGHALEKVQADVIARYQRLKGREVFFVTGTDEHGAKIARAAEAAKKTPQEFVDEISAVFAAMDKALNVSYDTFIRTTDKKVHWPAAAKMWTALEAKGDLYKKEYEGLYCVGHEAFITAKDLNQEGICEIHGAAPEAVKEENYFFRLSQYTGHIKEAIRNGSFHIVPKERENEIMALLEEGLDDVSFSRPSKDLAWGIPVPGDEQHTMYVWADALTNYLSAIGYAQETAQFKAFWPADVQVIGKDILRFHAAIWPAMLMSAVLPLPRTLLVHGFISVDGTKMSKSLGNVVDPFDLVQQYGADATRYYVLAEIPTTQDGDFSYEKFEARYNADLALGLGNFVARVTTLGERHIQEPLDLPISVGASEEISTRFAAYHARMEEFRFNEAIAEARSLIQFGDRRINETRVWELPERDTESFRQEMADMGHVAATVAWMLLPIMPDTATEILSRLGLSATSKEKWVFRFTKGPSLFERRDREK